MIIHRVMSFLGETVELAVTMPLYDSVSGAMTLTYTRAQGGEDMPYENTLNIEGEDSYAELSYRTYETITGTTMYQGTLIVGGPEEDGVQPKPVRAAFDLSSQICHNEGPERIRDPEPKLEAVRIARGNAGRAGSRAV